MTKQIFTIEHALNAKSGNIIWELISTPEGLSKWLADSIIEDKDGFVFSWGQPWHIHETKRARIVNCKKNKFIRFVWDEETDENAYWELKIETFDLTGDYCLMITDFADKDDVDEQKELWQNSLSTLRRTCGL